MTRYEAIPPVSRNEAERALASSDSRAIVYALLGLALHDPDWRWVQDHCLHFTTHPDAAVRGAAVLCFGHLARLHRTLDLEKVLPVLALLQDDPEVAGRVSDALDDITVFIWRAHNPDEPGDSMA